MNTHAYCCPLCSVMPAAGHNLTHEQRRGAFRNPVLWTGHRTGKFTLVRQTGCKHGPHLPEMAASASDIIEPWNTWAVQQAAIRSAQLGLDPDRHRWFLYWLGIGELPV